MAYIGDKPSQTLASPTSQYFNGDGSTVAFTLNRPVNVAEDLEVFVNNIQQEPGVGKSYTATGTTLTFDAAPSAGTANVYVVYRGLAEVTTRLEHDPNAALAATTGTFSGNVNVTGDAAIAGHSSIGVNAVASTRALTVAGATDGSGSSILVCYNSSLSPQFSVRDDGLVTASGSLTVSDNVGIGTTSPSSKLELNNGGAGSLVTFTDGVSTNFNFSTSGTVGFFGTDAGGTSLALKTTGAERMRIDSVGRVTMPYQPAFCVRLNSGSYSSGTVAFDQVQVNVGSHYSTSNGRFTAPVAGRYVFFTQVASNRTTTTGDFGVDIRKNGAVIIRTYFGKNSNNVHAQCSGSCVIDLSANDWVDVSQYASAGTTLLANGNHTNFGGHFIG